MRKMLLLVVLLVSLAVPAAASAASTAQWSDQANKVCVVWLAKAKAAFKTPVKAAGLYNFAVKAKTLESQELAVLAQIPARPSAGTAALNAMNADVAMVGSAIAAWDAGNQARFVTILKQYLNDHRVKTAFAAAGAAKCG
jgi:hypothetical protein